jgi:hypothetical protein
METIYKKIVETFNNNKAVFTDKGLPAIKQIDINYGQTDRPEEFEIFFPSIFISWEITEQNSNEPSLLTLDFHILQYPGAGTENFSDRLSENIEYLNMIATCKYILNHLRANNTSGLSYAGERPAITPYFRYHIVSYRCFIDKVDDSLTKGKLDNVELEDYTKDFEPKTKADIPSPPDIETMQ